MIDSYYTTFPDQLNSGELCCCHLGVSNSSAHSDQEGNIHREVKWVLGRQQGEVGMTVDHSMPALPKGGRHFSAGIWSKGYR